VANKDKATHDQAGLDNRREITNTGGRLDADPSEQQSEQGERTADDRSPATIGKSGDDAWHHRSNRRGDRGEDAEPMRGGNLPRPPDE